MTISAAAFVAFGDHLEHELGGALGQRQVAQLVADEKLDAGVAADDPGELAAALGLLELVRERGESGEPDASSLLAGADGERDRQDCLAGTGVAEQDDRLAVIDPGAIGERGDRGLRDLGVISEPEVLQSFDQREPGVDQPAPLAPLGAFGDLGFQ